MLVFLKMRDKATNNLHYHGFKTISERIRLFISNGFLRGNDKAYIPTQKTAIKKP